MTRFAGFICEMELTLKARALRYLARREHSRLELAHKLGPYTESPRQVEDLLDELQRRGWLSEQRVVEQMVHARRAKFGAARIVHELREKGIADELIEEALPQLKQSELEAARSVWQKKFGKPPENAKERAKQMRFLQSRGFGLEVIGKVLRRRDAQ